MPDSHRLSDNAFLTKMSVTTLSSLIDALAAIDAGGANLAMVLDDAGKFCGLITDGDLRRALLSGASLQDSVERFISINPLTVSPSLSRPHVIDLMRSHRLNHIPVVDDARHVVGLHVLGDLIGREHRPETAVIMAGGRGSRLFPLTANTPKPMLLVAGRPILEWIVLHVVSSGITNVVISTGYLGSQIEEHFANGEGYGCNIHYVRDEPDSPRGSGGALALVASTLEGSSQPLLVMNGDLMTQCDLGALLDHHARSEAVATIATRAYVHEIPFGVITTSPEGRVSEIKEKPQASAMVNAGIYVLSPAVLERVPDHGEFPITDLLVDCLQRGEPVSAWLFDDDWQDVGRVDDLNKARGLV